MFEKIQLPPINKKETGTEALREKLGELDIIDIEPEKLKTEIPVLVAPGWSISIDTVKTGLVTLAEKGRRVLSLEHTRKQEIIENDGGYADVELQKALALIGLLESKGIQKADVVAYSEAGINATIAAEMFPEKFRNIIYVSPAGMVGKRSTFVHSYKFFSEVRKVAGDMLVGKNDWKKTVPIIKDMGVHAARNPLMSVRESDAIAKADILQAMKRLKESGIGISVISGVDDLVFPMDQVQEKVTSDVSDGFYSVKGGHLEIALQPEKFMGAIDGALEAQENKKK
ncbi:MAG TPA: hypothetical protein DCX32_03825 [Candidatus Moranbacteria bacterium]|nr:MAG: hypothetical protein UW87_C0025G0018 [Candidatus Moranbacteria bacterium GW2011_GWC2_45_10]KKT94752.1 MAG: hypothetical protein UW95_C0009G0019 [Parcubacteria group bacterium GW2011_GWC1_45_14]HAV11640.1 hypothetical protein [Candidatus Moranbacteria bacterium]